MRLDFNHIAALASSHSSVLDLGCGNGEMLQYLQDQLHIRGVGADINRDNLIECFRKGVQAVYCDINNNLAMFHGGAFDVVVLSDTLQSVRIPPRQLLQEMLRIGNSAIVAFPNFGYWKLRLQLLGGYMPRDDLLPYAWDNTPNARYCTISDFEKLCDEESLRINKSIFLTGQKEISRMPNVFAQKAIYHLSR